MGRLDKFLMICIIVLPGIYIGDNYISFTDIVIPLIFLEYKIANISKLTLHKDKLALCVYVFLCALSIIAASINSGDLYIISWLKFFRLLYMLMVSFIATKMYKKKNDKTDWIECVLEYVMICGTVSGIISMILFFSQSTIFNPTQIMLVGGRIMYRASGVYGDAQTQGLMMSVVFVIALICFSQNKKKLLAVMTMAVSLVVIVLSDTRAALFGTIIAIIAYEFKRKKITVKSLGFLVFTLVAIIILYNYSGYFNRVINERMLPLIQAVFSGDRTAVALLSVNRFDIWNNHLQNFSQYSVFQKLIGSGYKVEVETTDNNFVYALMTTGYLGFISFSAYWIGLYKKYLFQKHLISLSIYIYSFLSAFILFLFTCDMMTLYRPMYLFIFLLQLSICENEGDKRGIRDEH